MEEVNKDMITEGPRVIQLFEKALQPQSTPFLSTTELLSVLEGVSVSHALEHIIGELLLRLWLFRARRSTRLSSALYSFVRPELRDAFVRIERGLNPNLAPEPNMQENKAWRFFVERATNFIRADGVVAMTVGRDHPEALAVPFRFMSDLPRDAKVQDASGRILSKWSNQIRLLQREWNEDLGIQLQIDVPHYMTPQGSSLALPVVLAKAMRVGRLPQFQALSILATGSFVGGCLRRINRKRAKGALATDIGAVFVAPGTDNSAEQIGIPYDMPLNDVIEFLNAEFATRGFGAMTPQQANDAIRNLQKEIHEGRTSLSAAARSLKRYAALLEQSKSKISAGAILRTHVLHGGIANHMGNPEEARSESSLAQACATNLRNPRAYVEAVANEVVALTDLGSLIEAETAARGLLRWVSDEMSGDEREQLWCEMIATGVLGGQPLLQRALQGVACGEEALNLLMRARAIAEELEAPSEIGRDSSQIVLWHALLKPEEAESAFLAAITLIDKLDRAETRVSRAYLQNARFLGAYRLLLTTGNISGGFQKWELPDDRVAYEGWPYATALKYRGALYADTGDTACAQADFSKSVGILCSSTSPLLNFIGATTALQAAESLGVKSARGARMLRFALQAFETNRKSEPANSSSPWIQRSLGLINNAINSALPHPQLTFRY